jgi:hypothetical protein
MQTTGAAMNNGAQMKLNRKARRRLKQLRANGDTHDHQLSEGGVLMLELADRMEGFCYVANLQALAADILDHYGNAESAINALRSGQVNLEKLS